MTTTDVLVTMPDDSIRHLEVDFTRHAGQTFIREARRKASGEVLSRDDLAEVEEQLYDFASSYLHIHDEART